MNSINPNHSLTVLVTGGCGFIGSRFIHLLVERSEIRVVNIDKLTYAGDLARLQGIREGDHYRMVAGEITNEIFIGKIFMEEEPWALVNFAAESHVDRSILDPGPFLHANVLGVKVLLEAARKYGLKRFVQVSTDEVYGDADGRGKIIEESPLMPSSPYAASKAAADLLCLAYQRTYGIPVSAILSNT